LNTFKQFGLSDQVLRVLSELGFEKPTDIQVQSLPVLMEGNHDFIGLAQTGTGKTAAFGLPLLERIDTQSPHTQALVLAPTRELGQQIAEQLNTFSKYLDKVNVLPVYGGAPIVNQIRALKKTQHVIIATPGRLIDLIKRKSIRLNRLRFLVLDEADEMLNMGFKEDIDKILTYTPEEKLTWLFSATMPPPIKRIVDKYMDHPVEVRIDAKNKVNTNIEHQFAILKQSNKTDALMRFLDLQPNLRGVVFCRTKRDTQQLAEQLLHKKYKADALHGDLSQSQRDRVMKRFKMHDLQVLIATDVAARGIDVIDLTHVFHFALPDDNAYYTHRSGRTARAGKKGISISFINGREVHKIRRLEKLLGISFSHVRIPNMHDIAEIRVENWCLEVLEQRPKGKLDRKLLEKVHMLFSNLSKEELAAKMLAQELESLDFHSSKDLNEMPEKIRADKKPHHGRRAYKDKRRWSGNKNRWGGSGGSGNRKGKSRAK
jgi:ATP-dependent RNA helicase DeaD